MKLFSTYALVLLFAGMLVFLSCKKEKSCEGCLNNKPPIAVAGPDQAITLPTDSISLDGSVSDDPDGMISEWRWKKISGPAFFNIVSSVSSKTIVRSLVVGTYKFELKVTDDKGLTAADTVQIIVDSVVTTNHPPIANAGPDTTLILPTNTNTLDGSGSTDPDNNIVSYAWVKISGPSSFTIANTSSMQTQLTNLVQGFYQFELKVTDAGGLFSKDTMQVNVNPQLPPLLPQLCDTSRPHINAQLIPISILSQARSEMAVASTGNKILFAGGKSALPGEVSSRVDIYDIANNTWSTAELSLGRVWIGAVAGGNKIFFAGGIIGGDSFDNVDIYDESTNTWTLSHLSRAADCLAATTVGNKVFFAGGNWGNYAVSTVDIYNLTTDTWSTVSLSTPRNFITGVSVNNKVYFTGGDLWTGQMSNVIDIYDNTSDAWSTSTLQMPRSYHAGIAVNDIIYFAGGKTSYNPQPICSVETLDANTGVRTIMNLFGAASWWIDAGQNAVLKNNKIIFLRHSGGADANKFDIYDIQTNSWSIGVLPQPIPKQASVISVNNTVYIAGGSVNGVLSNQVWKLEF